MKNFFSLLLAAALSLFVQSKADSQISIDSSDVVSSFAVGNSETTYVSLDTAVMDIGTSSSSTSQTWTAPSVTFPDSLRMDNVDPSSTPFSASFPGATYARESSESLGGSTTDTYLYFQASNDSIIELGLGEHISGIATDTGFVVPFNHASLYLPVPLQLGDIYTTAYDSTNLGKGNTMATSTLETIDAYGTLNLPKGSFGALRARGVTTTRFYARFVMVYDTTTYTISWYTEEGYGLTVGVDSGSVGIARVNSVTMAYPGTPATFVKESPDQPHNFVLAQNYPNPFNPTTAISYELSAVSDVTLKVYDVLGREVATLVNEKQNAGRYSVTFDGSRLASGVYFYRIIAGNYTSTKKFVLVK